MSKLLLTINIYNMTTTIKLLLIAMGVLLLSGLLLTNIYLVAAAEMIALLTITIRIYNLIK